MQRDQFIVSTPAPLHSVHCCRTQDCRISCCWLITSQYFQWGNFAWPSAGWSALQQRRQGEVRSYKLQVVPQSVGGSTRSSVECRHQQVRRMVRRYNSILVIVIPRHVSDASQCLIYPFTMRQIEI